MSAQGGWRSNDGKMMTPRYDWSHLSSTEMSAALAKLNLTAEQKKTWMRVAMRFMMIVEIIGTILDQMQSAPQYANPLFYPPFPYATVLRTTVNAVTEWLRDDGEQEQKRARTE